RPAAIEPERTEIAPIGAHLQYRLLGEELVLAAEWCTAAEFAWPHCILDEFVSGDLQRLLAFGHFDRLRGHVGVDMRVAVEPVGIGPRAPGAAREIDIDERRAIGVVSAD